MDTYTCSYICCTSVGMHNENGKQRCAVSFSWPHQELGDPFNLFQLGPLGGLFNGIPVYNFCPIQKYTILNTNTIYSIYTIFLADENYNPRLTANIIAVMANVTKIAGI